jgi:phosphoglycolate phosphatase-like HAD superfamily hydrolase
MARIRYVILDFDGTCTQVDRVQERFLAEYGKAIHADDKAWDKALATVRKAAPHAGWTLANAPSTAPAGADPFILAGEASALLARARGGNAPDVFKTVYNACVAPFRAELIDVLDALTKKVKVAFISNSGETDIGNRLTDLLPAKLRAKIHVSGGAQKFLVKEPLLDSKLTAAERDSNSSTARCGSTASGGRSICAAARTSRRCATSTIGSAMARSRSRPSSRRRWCAAISTSSISRYRRRSARRSI